MESIVVPDDIFERGRASVMETGRVLPKATKGDWSDRSSQSSAAHTPHLFGRTFRWW